MLVGDKCVWADISYSGTHHMNVFLFNGTVTEIGRGIYYCIPDGGGSVRAVRADAVWSDRERCRQWAFGELQRMKDEFNRTINAEIAKLR